MSKVFKDAFAETREGPVGCGPGAPAPGRKGRGGILTGIAVFAIAATAVGGLAVPRHGERLHGANAQGFAAEAMTSGAEFSEPVAPRDNAPVAPVQAETAPDPVAEPAIGQAATAPAVAAPQTDVAAAPSDDIAMKALPAGSVRFGEPLPTPVGAGLVASVLPGDGIDAANTGSIAEIPDPVQTPVVIADSEAETVRIETELARAGADDFEVPKKRSNLNNGRATKWVNLRAGPDNEARVLAIVPANASLRAQASCRHWCKVEYKGRSGYIYKSFIRML
jgi:hypothetical protein